MVMPEIDAKPVAIIGIIGSHHHPAAFSLRPPTKKLCNRIKRCIFRTAWVVAQCHPPRPMASISSFRVTRLSGSGKGSANATMLNGLISSIDPQSVNQPGSTFSSPRLSNRPLTVCRGGVQPHDCPTDAPRISSHAAGLIMRQNGHAPVHIPTAFRRASPRSPTRISALPSRTMR